MTVAPTYHTLPHPSSHGTSLSSTMMWGPLEPPNTPKPWSLSCLRPAPPLRPSAALCYKEVSRISFVCLFSLNTRVSWFLLCLCNQDLSKSPKSVKKLLPKRKPERKQSEEEFALRKSKCFWLTFIIFPFLAWALHVTDGNIHMWVMIRSLPLSGTAALEEDAQILKVIEAYCTSAKTRQTLNSSKKTEFFSHYTCACTNKRG